jgi:hypothetical protein
MHNDEFMPLCDAGVYSIGSGKDAWQDVTPAELREMLEGTSPPIFRTILAKTGEDTYQGLFYIDIDAEDVAEAIDAMCKVLDKLESLGLDLGAVRFFATGGKGFHAEIPSACFMSKPGPVEGLPRVYREMAHELYVNCWDLRVYSAGRGRLWRVPNVFRPEKNTYKVPVTAGEIRTMTAEGYAQLCSKPRPFPAIVPPVLCSGLAALFAQGRDKVSAKASRVHKWSKAEAGLRQRFSGNCPPPLQGVMGGQVQSPVGFNELALQVCLLAHALGWDEDRLIAECKGLIANHDSDGHRYNSPRKRENELRRMFDYTEGNVAYSFSVAGLRSILPKGARSPDLQGLEADESEDAPDYVELLDAADGDTGEIVAVARRAVADPSLSKTEAEAVIKRAAKSAGVAVKVLKTDIYQPEDSDKRAIIDVRRNDYSASVDSCMAVLPSVPALRVRAGALVEVVRGVGGVSVAAVTLPRLGYLVSQVARWNYGDSFGSPDTMVLQGVMAAGAWPGVPELVGLLHQPTIDATGNIIAGAGNHSGMEACFSAAAFPAYAGTAEEALKELRGLIREFPFASALDESAALSAILTAVARPMLSTAPAFLVAAHDLGTGKSCLAELIGLFAGEDVTMRRWAQRAEEQDKSLLASLMEAKPSCVFDNLMHHWQSPTLAAILTAPIYSDRILGQSASASVSTRCLFIATGNNIKPVKDLSRRVVTIELDAKCENPLLREFSGDPIAEVRANRGHWVMCALRVLAEYLQGAGVSGLQPVASFSEWSRVVRGALVAAGLPDPGRTLVRNVEGDDDRDLLGHVLQVWRECFGDEPLTLRDVLQATGTASASSSLGDLRHLLLEVAEDRGEINARRLGKWVSSSAGRVVRGLKFAALDKTRTGVPWLVLQV